jgi:hypothetical protein
VLIVQGDGCLLQICHLGRLTGVLRARDEDREKVVRWRQGEIVGAESALAG